MKSATQNKTCHESNIEILTASGPSTTLRFVLLKEGSKGPGLQSLEKLSKYYFMLMKITQKFNTKEIKNIYPRFF